MSELSIAEAARLCGTSPDTLRYYERIGAVPAVERGPSGQRRYTPEALSWIGFVRRLRATGMPLREVVEYVGLAQQGEATSDERSRLLRRHRERVAAAAVELDDTLALLDRKIAIYAGASADLVADCTFEPLTHVTALS